MTLKDMALEYRETGKRFRARVAELKAACGMGPMSETERIMLRRRVCVLETMGREMTSTAKYLENYYGRDEHADSGEKGDSGRTGVSCAQTVSAAD